MWYVVAIFFPPLPVMAKGTPSQVAVNCLLTLCFWFPGVIHAWIVIGQGSRYGVNVRTNVVTHQSVQVIVPPQQPYYPPPPQYAPPQQQWYGQPQFPQYAPPQLPAPPVVGHDQWGRPIYGHQPQQQWQPAPHEERPVGYDNWGNPVWPELPPPYVPQPPQAPPPQRAYDPYGGRPIYVDDDPPPQPPRQLPPGRRPQ